MTTALALVQAVVDRSVSSYEGFGQRLLGDIWSAAHGGAPTPQTYASIRHAMLDSDLVSTDYTEAPAGAIHYFDRPPHGMGGLALGNGLVAMVGGVGYAIADLGKGVRVYDLADYPDRRYVGWSLANGKRHPIVTLTSVTAAEVVHHNNIRKG